MKHQTAKAELRDKLREIIMDYVHTGAVAAPNNTIDQILALCSKEAEAEYKRGYSDGVVEYVKAHKDTLDKMTPLQVNPKSHNYLNKAGDTSTNSEEGEDE